jgi:hypothetical protein
VIGPLKLFASCAALLLVSVLLVSLSASPAEAGPGSGAIAGDGAMPAPHEWVLVLLLFALVVAFQHCRQTHHQRS